MKWLILVLLISCGHENPPARDVGDSDGDTIPNYLETDGALGKYVAEVSPFQEMKGELMFKVNYKPVNVQLSNQSNISDVAKKLLTKSLESMRKEEYFSEWSDLKVESPDLAIPDGDYQVTLAINTEDSPQFLMLNNGKSQTELSAFHPRMDYVSSGGRATGDDSPRTDAPTK